MTDQNAVPPQLLHIVIGGELRHLGEPTFRDLSQVEFVGAAGGAGSRDIAVDGQLAILPGARDGGDDKDRVCGGIVSEGGGHERARGGRHAEGGELGGEIGEAGGPASRQAVPFTPAEEGGAGRVHPEERNAPPEGGGQGLGDTRGHDSAF